MLISLILSCRSYLSKSSSMATALIQDCVTSRDHISRVPQLQGASNYQQWATAIHGPLQMLGGWKIVTGEMLYAIQIDADMKT
jgi:hypothetical protein